jgi:hypothetical protein
MKIVRFEQNFGYETTIHVEEFCRLGYNSQLKVNRRFGGVYRLYLQGRSIIQSITTCFHADSLVGLFFDTENGSDRFHRNVG